MEKPISNNSQKLLLSKATELLPIDKNCTVSFWGKLPKGEWCHVAITRNNDILTHYINGEIILKSA